MASLPRRMFEYAETRPCRWDLLMDDFGKDAPAPLVRGHCDRCGPERKPAAFVA